MFISEIIDERQPYCVYHHIVKNAVFFIGSGILGRAFDHGFARRSEIWNDYVRRADCPVSVRIVHRCADRSEARRVEYDHVQKYRPITNLPITPGTLLDWQIKTIDGVTVATDAYTGWDIQMLPEGHVFANLKVASMATGISESAISNSISGRYPTVAGKTFRRVPAPERRFIRPSSSV